MRQKNWSPALRAEVERLRLDFPMWGKEKLGPTLRDQGFTVSNATAEMPWPIKAIQIDGGSEFMAEFETACPAKAIPLYVLPPRSPKLNGAVERCNGAWRYEFYSVADLPNDIDKIAEHVDAFQHLYNHFRPHGALDGKTPNHYLQICRANERPASHMS